MKKQTLVSIVLVLALLAVSGSTKVQGSSPLPDLQSDTDLKLDLASLQAPNVCQAGLIVDAQSGSFDDLEAAILTVRAAGGGTVRIPAGEFLWNAGDGYLQIPGGVNIIGAGVDKTIIKATAAMSNMFDVKRSGQNSEPTRISGISFVGWIPDAGFDNSGTAISIGSIRNFRIDHCNFEGFSYNIRIGAVSGGPSSVGVVDHCTIRKGGMPYRAVYGISVSAPWEGEERLTDLGTSEAVFIEDNTFIDLGHPTASFGGGHYVARYNLFQAITNTGSFPLDGHGPGFEDSGRGTRCLEIYNNVMEDLIDREELNWRAIGPRAGGGVIFNNTIRNFRHAVIFTLDTDTTEYPALDQVHDYYIWNNTLENVTQEPVWIYGAVPQTLILEGRDYFLRAPSMELDGFTYTPYTYPHPLTRELYLSGFSADSAIHLNWETCNLLPVTATWQITYEGTPGDQTSPITDVISSTSSYTLSGMTNYEIYTITLDAMLDGASILSATIRLMPTDKFAYLPLIPK